MRVYLKYIIIIIFFVKVNTNIELKFTINNNISQFNGLICNNIDYSCSSVNNIYISTYINDSIVQYNNFTQNCTKQDDEKNYFYVKYNLCNSSNDTYYMNYNENITYFQIVNFTKNDTSSFLSLNNDIYQYIELDYIEKKLIMSNNFKNDLLIKSENSCNNNYLKNYKKKRWFCKLDYILLGHKDLAADDIYLAKEIKDANPIAYLDNLSKYTIFPEEYLDYFFSSFFSELNDGCEKKQIKPPDYENTLYYITCPKKKIDIYTKGRKLSVIINKFSYQIINLFSDSLDFLEESINENYYFNILFENKRKDFLLGMGFFVNITIASYNNTKYIYSNYSVNYTDELTDINSDSFEKWVYVLTASSFTFVLLISTIVGCIHSKKVNKELKEMLNNKL